MSHVATKKPSPLLRFLKLFSDLLTLNNLAVLAGLAVIAATGLFGGWKAVEADADETTHFAPEQTLTVNPFEITVKDAFWTEDPAPLLSTYGDSVFFVMHAHISNTTDSPVSIDILAKAMNGKIPGSPLAPQSGLWSNSVAQDGSIGTATVYRAIDMQRARALQPGLGQDYWLVWELPPDTPMSADLQLEYYQQTLRASTLDGGLMWTDRVLLGVQDLTAQTGGKVTENG